MILIDADVIAYSSSSMADGKRYQVQDGKQFQYIKDAKKYVKANNLDDAIKTIYNPDPFNFALQNAKKLFLYILEQCNCPKKDTGYYDENCFKGYLTGEDNFRFDIATILPYKGERVHMRKPFHLATVREYLVEEWGCEIIHGQEADDELGIQATRRVDAIMAHTDKDIDMIPGRHYNWNRNEYYEVSEVDGIRNFYAQLLTGDKAVDNILGLFNVGPKSAPVLAVKKAEDEETMQRIVFEEYRKRFGNYAYQFMKENGQLLWIRKHRDEMWSPEYIDGDRERS